MPATTTATPSIGAYLERLGLDRTALDEGGPSVEHLFAIHRSHVERVPYETTWIHLGEHWGIDAADALERIAGAGRGGYCFHLNGALSALLTQLGYQVTRHVGGVHRSEPDAADLGNHLVLLVHDLPSDDHPDGTWYVDAGLGDALHEPLPLRDGTVQQGPLTFRLQRTPDGVADWHFTHDPAGSFAGMSFRTEATDLHVFEPRHRFLSRSPDSPFARTVTAQLRDEDGITALKGRQLTRHDRNGTATRVIDGRTEWVGLLTDTFRIDLSNVASTTIDTMWHRAFEAAPERGVAS